MTAITTVALIGFGEVGQLLAQDLASKRVSLAAWDIAFDSPHSRPSRAWDWFVATEDLVRGPIGVGDGLRRARSAEDAALGADLVISAVTAAEDARAAQAAAPGLAEGSFFLDLNSASPGQKRRAAEIIEAAGGRYVEAAVMSPILPKRIASPMLLGGPHAGAFLDAAGDLGFANAEVYAPEIGRAAAAKLCRSVMVKGVEALLTECLLTAHHYGVEEEVLGSLSNLLPLPDWKATAEYMISRALEHGVRRAEEMREAARTVEEAGVAPLMSRAIAERQEWSGARHAALAPDLFAMLEAMTQSDPGRQRS